MVPLLRLLFVRIPFTRDEIRPLACQCDRLGDFCLGTHHHAGSHDPQFTFEGIFILTNNSS
jgi:hypothetical protein